MSVNDKLALRWLDVVVIVLVLFCGLGAWSFADWVQKSYRSAEPPSELRYYEKHDVPKLQANLKSTEAELAATESRLFERTLDVTSAEAALPPPTQRKKGSSASRAGSSGAKTALDLEATKRAVGALTAKRLALQREVQVRSRVLAEAKEAAAREVAWSAHSSHWAEKGITLATALMLTIASLIVLRGAVAIAAAATGLKPRWRLVYTAALPALALIFAYQAAEFIGVVVVCLVLLVVLGLRHPARAPSASAEG